MCFGGSAAAQYNPSNLPTKADVIAALDVFPTAGQFFAANPDFELPVGEFAGFDLNNDAVDDLILAAFGFDEMTPVIGVVDVLSGWNSDTIVSISSGVPNDLFGFQAVGVPDLNGDGRNDLVISAPASNAGATQAGRVYVYSGIDGALLWTITGQTTNAGLGWSVAHAGDVNADGLADLLIGEPMGDQPGRAYVFFGRLGPQSQNRTTADADMILVATEPSGFGFSVAGAGDFDGDGADDLLIGAPTNDGGFPGDAQAGAVFVYSGATGQPLLTATGSMPGMHLGWSVAPAGDLNNDGRTDIIAGAVGQLAEDPQGTLLNDSHAFVYFGSATPAIATTDTANLTLSPDQPGDVLFGVTVEPGNDVTGDGAREILVTAWSAADKNPRLSVYSGADGAFLYSALLTGTATDTPTGGDGGRGGIDRVRIVLDNFGMVGAQGPSQGDLNIDATVNVTDLAIALDMMAADPPPATRTGVDCTGVITDDPNDPCFDAGGGGTPTGNSDTDPVTLGGDACARLELLLLSDTPLTPVECQELLDCILAIIANNLSAPNASTSAGAAMAAADAASNRALAAATATKRAAVSFNFNQLGKKVAIAMAAGALSGAFTGAAIPSPGVTIAAGAAIGALGGGVGTAVVDIISQLNAKASFQSMVDMFKQAVHGELPAGTATLPNGLEAAGDARQAAAQAWGDFVVNVVNPLIDQANNRRFLGGCCDNPNCNGNTP